LFYAIDLLDILFNYLPLSARFPANTLITVFLIVENSDCNNLESRTGSVVLLHRNHKRD